MKREFEKGIVKKVSATLVVTLIISFVLAAFLKTIFVHDAFGENVRDIRGTIDFIFQDSSELNYKLVLGSLTLVIFMGLLNALGIYKKGYQDASEHGVHGTSRWGKFEELKNGKAVSENNKLSEKDKYKTLAVNDGLIVGRKPGSNELLIIPRNTTVDNRNVLVVGSSGSAKGQSYVLPNLINIREETIIVTDPKGELYNATHQIKRDQGFDVYQIDFLNLNQAHYNPLDYVWKDIDAKKIAETIARNSAKDGKEDFFFTTARDLLTGLIIYCKEVNSKASIPKDVKRLFYKVSEDENYLRELCEDIGDEHPAYDYLKDASVADGKTRTSILSSFAQQTAIFSLRDVSNMTTHSDFNLLDFQKRKSILYVKIPMKSNPVEALTATFFDQIISVFYDVADKHGSVLPIDTTFLFDEFANLGKINDYEGTLSTCRGLGISMNTIIQDFAQLEKKYGKDVARTIINNHDTLLYLRTKDVETAKYLSQMSGPTTARMTTGSTSTPTGFFNFNTNFSKSTSEQYVQRPLITEGEIINIKPNDCFVFISGYYPLKMEKSFQYKLYGDFLFKAVTEGGKTKYKLNYHEHRTSYLKFLGVPEQPLHTTTEDNNNNSDGGIDIPQATNKEAITELESVTLEIAATENEVENPVAFIEKANTEQFSALAEEFLKSVNSVEKSKNENKVSEKELDTLELLEEKTDLDIHSFKESEQLLKEIEKSNELYRSLDTEFDNVLNELSEEINTESNGKGLALY